MASEQKKQQKKKLREKEVRKKVLAKREQLQAPARAERQLKKRIKRVVGLQKALGDRSMWSDEQLLAVNDDTLSQLEKNVKILNMLEAQYADEHIKKAALNKELEDKGLMTLEDKMNYMHTELAESQKAECGDSCGCHTQVADVEVIKAPVEEIKEEN